MNFSQGFSNYVTSSLRHPLRETRAHFFQHFETSPDRLSRYVFFFKFSVPSDTNLGSLAKILEKHGNAW